MAREKMTPDERISKLEAQRSQLAARIAKERAKVSAADRKKDTRRKIIAGALALEHAEKNEGFGGTLQRLLNEYVTKPAERELFGLPPLSAAE